MVENASYSSVSPPAFIPEPLLERRLAARPPIEAANPRLTATRNPLEGGHVISGRQFRPRTGNSQQHQRSYKEVTAGRQHSAFDSWMILLV